MALLDRLVPAWRHSDPEVRAAAVRELNRAEREILASVARTDRDIRVRRLAIKKIDDVDLLHEVGRNDADEELRALAIARADDLLVEQAISRGTVEDCAGALARLTRPSHRVTVAVRAFHPSIRRAALSSVSEQRPIADIARRSDDPQIGLDAIARVTDVSLLRRIAGSESRPEVALAAVSRIDDPELLLEITNDPHTEKSVRKRARAMLDTIVTDDHPIRVAARRARQITLCVTIERLGEALDPTGAAATLREAESEWRELSAHATADPELEARFRQACHVIAETLARTEARIAKHQQREAALRQALAARQHLCDTVEAIEGPETPERLERARAAWRALAPTDDPHCHELASHFALAVQRCEQRHERWRVRDAFRSQLEALVIESEHLVTVADAPSAARTRAVLEKRWTRLASSPEGTKWLASERALQQRFLESGEALSVQAQTLQAQRRQRDGAARAQLQGLCARLEQLVQATTFRQATVDRALEAAAGALRQSPPLPAPEREALRQRLTAAQQALAQRVEEHARGESWKRWANADIQQQLIEQAEALLVGDDPEQILREIGRLEREWKRFAVAPRDRSQVLWDRFRCARDALRRRGDTYLAENLTKKEALCVAVEQLADSTQWAATAAAIRQMQEEWKQIGPVRNQLSAALFERFRAPANRFFERYRQVRLAREEERREMLTQMRALCEAAEALADSTEWDVTAAEIKHLQVEAQKVWGSRRTPGPRQSPRSRETDVLRDRFHVACDRFFDRYRQRDKLELDAKLAGLETIVAELESLRLASTGPEAPNPEEVTRQLKNHLTEWGRLAPTSPGHTQALSERLQAACDAIEADFPDGLPDGAFDAESNVPQREKLCVRLERLAASLATSIDEPSPTDLAERLKLALAANTIGGPATSPREQLRRETLETAERLRERWRRLGPIVGSRARALARRFEKAAAEFTKVQGAHGDPPPGSEGR